VRRCGYSTRVTYESLERTLLVLFALRAVALAAGGQPSSPHIIDISARKKTRLHQTNALCR
jgi:hypothetical protein